MSIRGWVERVEDILDAIEEIETFTAGMDLAAFRLDAKTVRAIELNLIVIGEAASHIPDDIHAAHPDIPWSFMKAMRNRLVHAYFNVDPQILWDTVQNDVPPLRTILLELIASWSESTESPTDDL